MYVLRGEVKESVVFSYRGFSYPEDSPRCGSSRTSDRLLVDLKSHSDTDRSIPWVICWSACLLILECATKAAAGQVTIYLRNIENRSSKDLDAGLLAT